MTSAAGPRHSAGGARGGLMLTLAIVGFAGNFWAWALLSPLGLLLRENGTLGPLTESQVALMVAVPVIVGSLGRIVVGALTDRVGAWGQTGPAWNVSHATRRWSVRIVPLCRR